MKAHKAAIRVGFICLKVAIFVLIFFGIVYLGQTTYRYTHAVFSEQSMEEEPGRTVKISIPENVSSSKLAEVLEEKGLIKDAGVFKQQMKMAHFGDLVQAGTYELNTSMTPSEIIKILSGTEKDE